MDSLWPRAFEWWNDPRGSPRLGASTPDVLLNHTLQIEWSPLKMHTS